MNFFQLWVLEILLLTIKYTRPLRSHLRPHRPSRRAHWINVRSPRYERQLLLLLAVVIIAMSRAETIIYNVMFGAALSFGFILYVLIRLIFYKENN